MERINIEALRGQIDKKLDEIENQIIGIDEIEDKSYMDDRGGLEEANRIAERMEQYGDDEESQLLRGLDEGYLRLKSVREAKIIKEMREKRKETATKNFISDLKDEKEKREIRIAELDEKIQKAEEEKGEFEKARDAYRSIKGVKFLTDQEYVAADEKTKEYMKKVRNRANSLRKFRKEKAELKEDNENLNKLIEEIDLEKEFEGDKQPEQKPEPKPKQEPEQEPEQKPEQKPEQQEQQPMQKPEQKPEQQEQQPMQKPEQKPEQQEQQPVQKPEQKQEQQEQQPVQKPEQKPAQQKQQPEQKPAQQVQQSEQKPVQQPTQKPRTIQENSLEVLKIRRIRFYINQKGKPTYSVTFINGEGKEETKSVISGYKELTRLTENGEEHLKTRYGIQLSKKYYDPNIESVIKKVMNEEWNKDKEWSRYVNIIKDKFEENRKDYGLEIDYDFSNLQSMPKNREKRNMINYIKGIAKANYNVGIASYEKKQNVMSRLISKIKTKRIESAKKREEESNIDALKNMYEVASKEPNFNEETFIKKAIEIRPELSENYIKEAINSIQVERNIDDDKSQNAQRKTFMDSVKVASTNGDLMNSIHISNSTLTYSDKAKADIEEAKKEIHDDEKEEI